jgi:hypothetical protein
MATPSDDRLILILDPDTGALVAQCSGPRADGLCPNASAEHAIPCGGRRAVPARGTGIEGWRLTVFDDPEDGACPLASLVGW